MLIVTLTPDLQSSFGYVAKLPSSYSTFARRPPMVNLSEPPWMQNAEKVGSPVSPKQARFSLILKLRLTCNLVYSRSVTLKVGLAAFKVIRESMFQP